jgi:hypothetical protein
LKIDEAQAGSPPRGGAKKESRTRREEPCRDDSDAAFPPRIFWKWKLKAQAPMRLSEIAVQDLE